jgi:hypothetical protein
MLNTVRRKCVSMGEYPYDFISSVVNRLLVSGDEGFLSGEVDATLRNALGESYRKRVKRVPIGAVQHINVVGESELLSMLRYCRKSGKVRKFTLDEVAGVVAEKTREYIGEM